MPGHVCELAWGASLAHVFVKKKIAALFSHWRRVVCVPFFGTVGLFNELHAQKKAKRGVGRGKKCVKAEEARAFSGNKTPPLELDHASCVVVMAIEISRHKTCTPQRKSPTIYQ